MGPGSGSPWWVQGWGLPGGSRVGVSLAGPWLGGPGLGSPWWVQGWGIPDGSRVGVSLVGPGSGSPWRTLRCGQGNQTQHHNLTARRAQIA